VSQANRKQRIIPRGLAWYWLPPLAWMGLIFFLSSQRLAGPSQPWLAELLTKGAHFSIYAILAFWWWRALSRGRRVEKVILAAVFVISALYGASDEFHQSFVPGRDASWLDWLTDVVGAAVALWVIRRKGR
jgi:VanZ family protein